jgi:hypothetical protein
VAADPKFDPIVQAQKAQELRALATKARDALRADTVERAGRLGRERDDAAREAYGTEQEIAAANQQVKRELAAAEKFEKEAATLERKASELERNQKGSITAEGEAEDVREQAAEQQALATAARARVRSAEDAVDRMDDQLYEKRLEVERLEKQIAAEPARRAQVEQAVDAVEWHAREAEGFARNVQVVVDEELRAAAAERTGDAAVAAAARARATDLRQAIEAMGDMRATTNFLAPDAQQLALIGITLPATFYDTPGFPAAAPSQPATGGGEPSSQLDDAGPVDGAPAQEEDVLTAGLEAVGESDEVGVVEESDPVLGDTDVSSPEPALSDETMGAEVAVDVPEELAMPEFTSVADESDVVLAHFFEPEPQSDFAVDLGDVEQPSTFDADPSLGTVDS